MIKTKDLIGKCQFQRCGFMAECIEINTSKRILIRFENGFVKEVDRDAFLRGRCAAKPSQDSKTTKKINRIGEINAAGEKIIKYYNLKNISVLLPSGDIKTGVRYPDFVKRSKPSTYHKTDKTSWIGLEYRQNCGLVAKCIKAQNGKNITVEFEDGTIKEHTRMDKFRNGQINHPTLKSNPNYHGSFLTFTTQCIGKTGEKTFYKACCKECGYKEILTPQLMIRHICKK